MKNIMIIAALGLALASCGVNQSDATRVVEAQGMTDVKVTGYSFFGCSEDDLYRSTFTAKNVKGESVEGVICGGIFKGYTVRFY